jgi:hypothetical protein
MNSGCDPAKLLVNTVGPALLLGGAAPIIQ